MILAIWAHRSSEEEGRLAWVRENPPTGQAWESALSGKGFRKIEDPDWKEKAYAEMPEASRKKDSALLSEDRHIAAVRSSGEWLFYQLGGIVGGKPPGTIVRRELWEGMGIGWEALARMDRIEFPKVRMEVGAKPPGEWADPRRIRY